MDEFTGWFEDALMPYEGRQLEFTQRPREVERRALVERSVRRARAEKERRK